MQTNQDMKVKIGNGLIKIGHLTQMGKLNDIFEIGNDYRIKENKKPKKIEQFLKSPDTWEFIIEVERKYGNATQTSISDVCLSEYRSESGEMRYSELIKKLSVIKSQRGGKPENRGIWTNLQILLKGAMYLSPKLELEVIDVFLDSKILYFRDIGGDNFKVLNKYIDTLPDRIGKNNKGIYIQIALILRNKLEIFETKGYNEEEHNALIQKKRSEYLQSLTDMIKVGFIRNYNQLKDILRKL